MRKIIELDLMDTEYGNNDEYYVLNKKILKYLEIFEANDFEVFVIQNKVDWKSRDYVQGGEGYKTYTYQIHIFKVTCECSIEQYEYDFSQFAIDVLSFGGGAQHE